MIQNFPFEILLMIVWNLSIKDARNFCNVWKSTTPDDDNAPTVHKFQQLSLERKSSLMYLSTYFNNASGLMDAMLVSNILISGSRALEFFSPDSIIDNSDWDFYATNDIRRNIIFMEYMKHIGTEWHSTLSNFEFKLGNDDDVLCVSHREMRYFKSKLPFLHMKESTSKALSDAIEVFTSIEDDQYQDSESSITYTINGRSITKKICVDYSSYDNFDIINGTLKQKNKVYAISLIINRHSEQVADILDHIRDFDITIVQCAISPVMSFHMYPDDAFDRISTLWNSYLTTTMESSTEVPRHKAKYSKRNYQFNNTSRIYLKRNPLSTKYVKRSLVDSQSIVIVDPKRGLPNFERVNFKDYLFYKILGYEWIEGETKLHDISEIYALRRSDVTSSLIEHDGSIRESADIDRLLISIEFEYQILDVDSSYFNDYILI